MAVNLVSPGVKIREVDLTIGRIDQANDQVAGFAGAFQKGPVELPVLIQTEQQLLQIFGKPLDGYSDYWLTASNYLSYGGIMQIVRVGSSTSTSMTNANSPVGVGSTTIKINSIQDYINQSENSSSTFSNFSYTAKNPGSWANGLDVYTIDAAADQTLSGITTDATNVTAFEEIGDNPDRTGTVVGGSSTITGISTSSLAIGLYVEDLDTGTFNLIPADTTITGIGSSAITLSNPINGSTTLNNYQLKFGNYVTTPVGVAISVGYGVSVTVNSRDYASTETNSKETFNGYFKGIITGIGPSSIDVKLISRHETGKEAVIIDYSENNPLTTIESGNEIKIIDNSGNVALSTTIYEPSDWYNNQTISINGTTVYWKNIAERPSTSQYTSKRGGKNDELNIIVVDTNGKINGNAGEILEKFTKLSKAKDAKISPVQSIYYLDYIRDNSSYIFAGNAPSGNSTRFNNLDNYDSYSNGAWGKEALNVFFNVSGNKRYTFSNGADYEDDLKLTDLNSAYSIFENVAEYPLNYIISGPSGGSDRFDSQIKANNIIAIAEKRKDCIAVISPHQQDVVNTTNSTDQTNNIVKFFNGLSASTYAVFDSGYKYTYDRFNEKFVYLACNSDVAGLMARTSINQYPWYSPAGASRGVLNNAIKLAYNPSETQRDILYQNKINPIISSPGQGIILYGDKTASANVSAFDRINVRKLFLTIEKSIETAARAQLFEFNDAITRANFVNIVEPYLRDVKAKRGITEFLLVCDETNNTPDVIDSNQFRADIYVKPARSINFIGLTFVATRTGISFSEIVGTV